MLSVNSCIILLLVNEWFTWISAKLAYIKDTFIAKGERAMKFLPSLWISIGSNYQPQQRLVQSGLLSRLMILTHCFKQLHQNNNRLTRSIITLFLPVVLKDTDYQTALISSYFLVTPRVSLSHNNILAINFTQNIYLIPGGVNTS